VSTDGTTEGHVHPLLAGLNDEQRRAAATIHGPLLILAGAGSGKTRVLTRRIAYLLENGVRPWNILAVTFTNKAAGEMKERVGHLVGEGGKDIWVSTFHSTCVRILRRDITPLGYDRGFVIYDDDDQVRVLKGILAELKLDPKQHPPSMFRQLIDRAKNAMKGPAEAEGANHHFKKVYQLYTDRMKAASALDFNDLVNKVVELWQKHPDVLERWRTKFRYVLVDEYQDTNPAQYALVKLLCDHGERNLAVVGDDDQSIYSFRGADIQNILDFEKDFPNATVVRLEQNYRSTQTILDAASALVKRNTQRKDKTLWTDADRGSPIRVLRAEDENDEAQRVVAEIRRHFGRGRRPADLAIIYRTNAQSRPFEQALMQAKIPHVLVGGKKFYERREVRDLLSYLKLIVNPADDIAFARVINTPTRGLGDKAVQQIADEATRLGVPLRVAARNLGQSSGRVGNALAAFSMMMDTFERMAVLIPPEELVAIVADKTGYRAELEAEKTDEAAGRLENIEALCKAVLEDVPATEDPDGVNGAPPDGPPMPMDKLRAFLDRVSLTGQADELPDEGQGAVTLLTAHLAKGLEYPVVFVVGLVEKCFPHARAERDDEIEEERRLAYVAITRAREELTLTMPGRRLVRPPAGSEQREARWMQTDPSRFLDELPRAVLSGEVPAARAERGGFGGGFGGGFRAPAPPTPPSRPSGIANWIRPPAPPPPRAPLPPSRPLGAPASGPPTSGALGFGAFGAGAPRGAPARPSAPSYPAGMRKLAPDSMEEFKIGVEVFHPLLGAGTISKRDGIPGNPKLTIHFRDHGPRTVFAASAGLEILLP
jgi:DNA helicase-2/ATP-dependent DNA helicase PcrA